MPKMKTRSGAKKRFKLTSSGKVKRNRANVSHILTKKSPKRKRQLRGSAITAAPDEKRMRRMLGC